MIDVRLDFNDRVSQIEKYLAFVWISDNRITIRNLDSISEKKIILSNGQELYLRSFLTENNDSYFIDNELVKILKSNTILLFYNLIEGTISALLNEFFGSINLEGKKYDELNLPVKKIWLKYKHRSFGVGEKKNVDYILSTIETILEELVQIAPKTISDAELGSKTIHNYDAYCKETNSNDISGNLDAREIRKIFSLYGLPEINRSCNAMLKVKNKRNSLAHGNETFAQVGSDFTIDELYIMKAEITDFLSYLLLEAETHIKSKKFLKTLEG